MVWRSVEQSCVAGSIMEVEYVVTFEVTKKQFDFESYLQISKSFLVWRKLLDCIEITV